MFVNAIMYYKVRDATKAVTNVDDYAGAAQGMDFFNLPRLMYCMGEGVQKSGLVETC